MKKKKKKSKYSFRIKQKPAVRNVIKRDSDKNKREKGKNQKQKKKSQCPIYKRKYNTNKN